MRRHPYDAPIDCPVCHGSGVEDPSAFSVLRGPRAGEERPVVGEGGNSGRSGRMDRTLCGADDVPWRLTFETTSFAIVRAAASARIRAG